MSDDHNRETQPSPVWQYASYGLAIAFALAGWFIPEFYDWTGADQSRPAPVIGWIALAITAGDLLAIAGLLIWHVNYQSKRKSIHPAAVVFSDQGTTATNQFTIRHLLAFSAIIAALLTLSRWISPTATAVIVFASVVAWAIVIAKRNRGARWWIALVVGSQFLPFLWVVRGAMESILGLRSSNAVLSLVPMVLSLPSMFPFGFVSLFLPLDIRTNQWFFIGCSALSLAIGVWLSCRGPKRTLAFGLIVGTCSLFGSFILNALMRA